jgi:hypothetical protein
VILPPLVFPGSTNPPIVTFASFFTEAYVANIASVNEPLDLTSKNGLKERGNKSPEKFPVKGH